MCCLNSQNSRLRKIGQIGGFTQDVRCEKLPYFLCEKHMVSISAFPSGLECLSFWSGVSVIVLRAAFRLPLACSDTVRSSMLLVRCCSDSCLWTGVALVRRGLFVLRLLGVPVIMAWSACHHATWDRQPASCLCVQQYGLSCCPPSALPSCIIEYSHLGEGCYVCCLP